MQVGTAVVGQTKLNSPIDKLIEEARQLLNAGKAAESIQVFFRAQELDPKNHQVLNELGHTLLQEGMHSEAIHYLEQGSKLLKQNFTFLGGISIALYEQGEFISALKYTQEALQQKPNYTPAQSCKIMALFQLGDYSQCIEYARQVLIITPKDRIARLYLGKALLYTDRYYPAFCAFEQLANDYYGICYAGFSLLFMKNYAKATEYFNRVLSNSNINVDLLLRIAKLGLGIVLNHKKQSKEARKWFAESEVTDNTKLQPRCCFEEGELYFLMSKYYLSRESFLKAEFYLENILDSDKVKIHKTMIFISAGKFEKASNMINMILKTNPHNQYAIILKERVQELKKSPQELKKNPPVKIFITKPEPESNPQTQSISQPGKKKTIPVTSSKMATLSLKGLPEKKRPAIQPSSPKVSTRQLPDPQLAIDVAVQSTGFNLPNTPLGSPDSLLSPASGSLNSATSISSSNEIKPFNDRATTSGGSTPSESREIAFLNSPAHRVSVGKREVIEVQEDIPRRTRCVIL